MFGYSRDELLGQAVEILVPERLREPHVKKRADYDANRHVWPTGVGLDLVGRRKDGTELPVDIGLSFIDAEDGVLIMSAITDISERKRAEESLRESEEWLSTTLNSIGDAVIATDGLGCVTFMNPAAQSLTGWKQEEAAGKLLRDVFNIVSEETGEPAEDPISKVVQEGVVAGLANHTVLIARDGTKRPIDDSGAPLRDAEGNISGVVLVFHDVSERRRAEEAVRESEERLRTVVSSLPVVLWALDRQGLFTLSEGRGLDALGLKPGQIVGRPVSEVYGDVPEILEDTRRALAGEAFTSIVEVGGVTLESRYSPLRDRNGDDVGVIGVANDITEQVRAAAQLRQLTARLLEAQEDDRRQVAYDIHDGLGQLIIAAAMHLEAFGGDRQSSQPPEVSAELEKARRCLQDAVVEMRRVVSELGPLLLEDLGLVEASRRLLADVAERAGWEIEFEGDVNGERLDRVVETALFRIVQEALANAAKHSGTKKVSVGFRQEGASVLLEVRDWGRGFEPDSILDQAGRGRHVGLVGMRERAALIGGQFKVESAPGDGTKLTVRILAAREGQLIGKRKLEVVEMVEPRRGREPARQGITVLIVDDHPMVREGLRSMLDTEGIEVVGEAGTGAEAVEKVPQLNPDVVLMDVRMPDMDGLAATEIVKQNSPETSVIVVSSYESKEYLRRAIEAGAAGYILKGMSRESLIDAVRLVRGGGSLVDARLLGELLREMGMEGSRFEGAAEGALEALSPRELEVLQLLVQGLTNKEIAQQMHYSVGTVKNVVQRVIEKLGVSDRTQAAVYAVRVGLNLS